MGDGDGDTEEIACGVVVVMVAVVVAADVLADMGDAEYYEMKSRGTSDDRR